MEKNGQIREGHTPSELDEQEKQAASRDGKPLNTTGHVAKRLVDRVVADKKIKAPQS